MIHDNYDPDLDEGVFPMKDGEPKSDGLYLVYLEGYPFPGILTLEGIKKWYVPAGTYNGGEYLHSVKIRKYLGPLPNK